MERRSHPHDTRRTRKDGYIGEDSGEVSAPQLGPTPRAGPITPQTSYNLPDYDMKKTGIPQDSSKTPREPAHTRPDKSTADQKKGKSGTSKETKKIKDRPIVDPQELSSDTKTSKACHQSSHDQANSVIQYDTFPRRKNKKAAAEIKEVESSSTVSPLTVIGGNYSFSLSDEGAQGSNGLGMEKTQKEANTRKLSDTGQAPLLIGNKENQEKLRTNSVQNGQSNKAKTGPIWT